MLFDFVTKNVATGANEDVFRIIKGVQMGDVDVSDESSLIGIEGKMICSF